MTTSITTSTTDSQMHNNIMAAGSRDRPPMLATGRYAQKCILEGPYTPFTVTILVVPATDDSPEVPERTAVETILNMSPKNKAHYESEKEAIHLLLTGIEDEIYSIVDACKTANDMWIAIERLQQGEPLNIQDVKSNLFWEFGRFTSHDGETMESYYSKFYKMMNEMIRNNLTVATMQVNYQKEVNEIHAERIAKNANPLALVATAQQYQDPYYQAPKSHKSYAPLSKQSSSTRSNAPTRYKGKDNDNQTGHFGNQRTVTVAGARETVGSQLEDTDEEIDEQELEAHYIYMAKIQEVPTADSGTDTKPLEKCKSNLEEFNTTWDSCLIALQSKQTELETYKTLNDRTVDYDKLERKLNETLGLLTQKEINIKEGLKLKAYEISVVKEKHNELVKQSFLTKSHYEGLVKEKTKVITDLKLKEEKDIAKMISMENQLKLLNEIVYKRNQSIQTIHMLAPKGSTFNGRPTFANPMYLKKAQSEKPCLYEISYDTSNPANRFVPDREETLTLEKESRSKLNKDLVKPYDYTKQNSLYEIFKPASQEYHDQLVHANEHMTGNLKLLCNFVEKYLGIVHFGNDQFALILGYGDLVQGNVMINRLYYVEGLNHKLFSVGQFCDADLEVVFLKSTCFVRDLQGNDLLTGNRGSDLYKISLQETTSSTLICYMTKASPTQAWLWHRRLSHLNFNYINLLSKKDIVIGLPKLKYVKDQLCSSCEHLASYFPISLCFASLIRSEYDSSDVQVTSSEMLSSSVGPTLHAYFKEEGIEHQTSTPRTPKQNGVVKRQNRTLVEAARTMLSASKLPLFFWAEAIATTCYTQNRSIIIPTHEKTAYHIINNRKSSSRHLHIFGCTCYLTRDGENLDKMKEKGDLCILVGYSTQSKGYRVYKKRT
ncbi:retrovirus-related pol polyprotein from transposon TNT 1-94 [Tanacetum coccineum]